MCCMLLQTNLVAVSLLKSINCGLNCLASTRRTFEGTALKTQQSGSFTSQAIPFAWCDLTQTRRTEST